MRKIAVTMGEPGGVGPEIIVKALSSRSVRLMCSPIVIGDADVMRQAVRLVKSPLKIKTIQSPSESRPSSRAIEVIQHGETGKFKKGAPSAAGGNASYGYIRKAVELLQAGLLDAICTAPISKDALKMAGVPFPGHTEMLASLTDTADYGMMLVGGPLRVLLVTTHKAIRDVPPLITRKAVLEKILLAKRAAWMLGFEAPRISVCGLNPHAGEEGLFGDEEIREIAPAIKEARRKKINATGPHPADTVFRKAYLGETDIVIAMYHDQGLAPLKMIAFDKGVNITVGLPFIRTSPDHGTAYDIAWQGTANPGSMKEALRYAASLNVAR